MSMLFGDSRIDAHDGALGFLFGGALENLQIMQNSSRGIGDVTNAVAYSSAALQEVESVIDSVSRGEIDEKGVENAINRLTRAGLSKEQAVAVVAANTKSIDVITAAYAATGLMRNNGLNPGAEEGKWAQFEKIRTALEKLAGENGTVSAADMQAVVEGMAGGQELDMDWDSAFARGAEMRGVDIQQDREALLAAMQAGFGGGASGGHGAGGSWRQEGDSYRAAPNSYEYYTLSIDAALGVGVNISRTRVVDDQGDAISRWDWTVNFGLALGATQKYGKVTGLPDDASVKNFTDMKKASMDWGILFGDYTADFFQGADGGDVVGHNGGIGYGFTPYLGVTATVQGLWSGQIGQTSEIENPRSFLEQIRGKY